MNKYYADMHIHIGRTYSGKPVKITGAKSLTFSNIIDAASNKKGLNIIGIIDCHSPEVIYEMEQLIKDGDLVELEDGGLQYGSVTVIPGSELEIYDEKCQGPIHVLCYFPTIETMKRFSSWLANHLKNIQLSSQRIYVSGLDLQQKVKQLGGLFIPAHVFTPFKSLYGKGVHNSLTEVFDPNLIDGIELGLSSDTSMASVINELSNYTFLSNSDAHSLPKIAREYQVIEMKQPTFKEFAKVLRGELGRRVVANYGLNPLLGKYHETVCNDCSAQIEKGETECPHCNSKKIINGVANRISQLASDNNINGNRSPKNKIKKQVRPPYIHQVPLEFIPGLGPKMLERLLNHFGTEMAILHEVSFDALKQVVPTKIAEYIAAARSGELEFQSGGGGKYGKVSK